MIALFVDKENDEATMPLAEVMEAFDLPKDVQLTINNTKNGESGVLMDEGRVVDISLANCYTLEDVVRELMLLIVKGEAAREERTAVEGL